MRQQPCLASSPIATDSVRYGRQRVSAGRPRVTSAGAHNSRSVAGCLNERASGWVGTTANPKLSMLLPGGNLASFGGAPFGVGRVRRVRARPGRRADGRWAILRRRNASQRASRGSEWLAVTGLSASGCAVPRPLAGCRSPAAALYKDLRQDARAGSELLDPFGRFPQLPGGQDRSDSSGERR